MRRRTDAREGMSRAEVELSRKLLNAQRRILDLERRIERLERVTNGVFNYHPTKG